MSACTSNPENSFPCQDSAAWLDATVLVAVACLLGTATGACSINRLDKKESPAEIERTAGPKRLHLDLGSGKALRFCWIAPGRFMIGPKGGEAERKREVIITKGFWMQETELTQEHWEAVMGPKPSAIRDVANLPVQRVSWNDCQEFLKTLNEKWSGVLDGLRADLPSEAEWEYACRAGSEARYSFGDEKERLTEYAWYDEDSEETPHPVGLKKPNAWGLYDMHGNVWEWCRDWYAKNAGGGIDPLGPDSGSTKVIRGGSWTHHAGAASSASRMMYEPSGSATYVGVRLVLRKP